MSDEAAEYRPPTPWVIWFIVGAIGVAYGAFMIAPLQLQNEIAYAFALIPQRFHADSPDRFNHWYEALGPIFGHALLHAGWWHAGINAFFIYIFGRYPAARLGTWRFVALVLISTVGSAVTYLAMNWNEHMPAVGASGALCGVVSAYYLSARPTWRAALADPLVRNQYGMMVLLNVVVMAVVSEIGWFPIAWEAHFGGFVAGALAWIALAPQSYAPAS